MKGAWHCPVCWENRFEQAGSGIRACLACGTYVIHPIQNPVQNRRNLEIEAQHAIRSTGNVEVSVWSERLGMIVPVIGKRVRLLDVGCGNGDFIRHAEKLGIRATGIELSRTLVKHLKRAGIPVRYGMSGIQNGSIRVATLFDVIEHVPDPGLLLLEVHNKLSAGGTVFITSPNGRGMGARLIRNRFWGLVPGGHTCMFNTSSLALLLGRSGFDVKQVQTDTIHWWYITDSPAVNAFVNRIVYRLAMPLRNFLFAHGMGDNITVVAVKR